MDVSVSVMQLNSPPATPLILESLPTPALADEACPRRARLEIDLLLLAIEALDLSGSEAILIVANELELQSIIKNRVSLWRLRSTNPLRRYSQRRPLTLTEAKALVMVGCYLARRLTVLIRQLLLAYQQLSDKQLSMEHHFRLSEYLERFRAHFRSRMNPKRAIVAAYNSDEKLDELALNLLTQLLFCTGTHGMQRFWASLFDGEVA
ncbi:FIG00875501: hypothetical protein [uncultured Leptolyngbya sp.]|jgi:hypothetical protein|uniref:DUF3038 domain-containing protein n=1 Tax=uncultured Leptolyngbya sp. TaxID=332963 RepID=A0A6J4MNL8_9CYAN|nr:DUF3038 domain-containing protein [Leptolyngbya sp. FACHB-321]CAA9364454.1 FIG00875501: hypothetical protein [uncultured Leptolyngbya sp.]